MRWADRLLRSVSSPRPAARRARLSVLSLEGRDVPSGTPAATPAEPDTVVKADPPAQTDPAPAGADRTEGEVKVEIIAGEPGAFETSPEDVRRDNEAGHLDDEIRYTLASSTGTPKPQAPLPQIGDKVWKDLNGNGLQDPGEPGIGSVTLQLFQGAKLVGTTVTDGQGAFAFNRWNVTNGTADTADDGLAAGTAYQIRVAGGQTALTGLRLATANAGTDELRDSDAVAGASGVTLDLTMGPDEIYYHYDIGYTSAATIGSTVWTDANNNGKKDLTEGGIPGVTVRLLDATGTKEVATTTTGADGSYLFTELVPGTYIVEIAQANFATNGKLHGCSSSTGTPGSPTGTYEGSKTPDPNGGKPGTFDHGTTLNGAVRCKPITVLGDTLTNKAASFGFFQAGTLGGKVFVDVNANGRADAEDTAGVAGVKVTAAGPAGVFKATTDATGAYSFSHLPAGTYTVTQTQPAGYRTSTPNLVTATVGATPATVNFGEARAADLAVSLSVKPWSVTIGGTVVLTYKVKNVGTADATGVTLLAPLPSGLKVQSFTQAGGTFDKATQRATIPTLAAGAEAVFTIKVRATQTATYRLTANVQGTATEDVVGNNRSTAGLIVAPVVAPKAKPLSVILASAFRR